MVAQFPDHLLGCLCPRLGIREIMAGYDRIESPSWCLRSWRYTDNISSRLYRVIR